jgi:3-deoxy-D-manno-octulosonic-acid transferase
VALVNGRISEKSFPRYRLIKPLMRDMLRRLAWIGVQTDSIAKRFLALGAPAARLHVLPTLKYDNAHVASTIPGQEVLAEAIGLMPEHQLLVGGSTGPGEEEALLDAYRALKDKYPHLRLAIDPRHPEVIPQVIEAINAHGLTPVLRTERPDGTTPSPLSAQEVFVLNTMGELRKMYALAFAVFVGRSLIKKGGGGSDMIEVAALAKPCCFGPYTSNFAEVVELLVSEKTAVIVADGEALTRTLEEWLSNPTAAQESGRRAQEIIVRQQGSTEHYVRELQKLLQRCDSRRRELLAAD